MVQLRKFEVFLPLTSGEIGDGLFLAFPYYSFLLDFHVHFADVSPWKKNILVKHHAVLEWPRDVSCLRIIGVERGGMNHPPKRGFLGFSPATHRREKH